jgi:hypothetical protein
MFLYRLKLVALNTTDIRAIIFNLYYKKLLKRGCSLHLPTFIYFRPKFLTLFFWSVLNNVAYRKIMWEKREIYAYMTRS